MLIEAVAAGIPVVATPFPHAVELLTDGPGVLVPHKNPRAIATAVRRVLTKGVAGPAGNHAATPRWPEVGKRYEALAQRVIATDANAVSAAPA